VPADLACASADGGEVISDFRVMGDRRRMRDLPDTDVIRRRIDDRVQHGGQRVGLEALAARAGQQDAAEGNSRGSRSSCFITVTLWPGRPSRMRDPFRHRAGLPGWPARPSRAGDLRWAATRCPTLAEPGGVQPGYMQAPTTSGAPLPA
jgi:hypothetical protein